MPLAVCATPIGNLADVTLRVLDELASAETRALRGHASHACPARAATGSGLDFSRYHQHNEASRAAELVPRLVAGERYGARLRCRASRASTTRARASSRPRSRPDVVVTVLPGPVRGRDGARRERARRRAVPLRRIPPAQRARSRCAVARARCVASSDRGVRVRHGGFPASLASLAAAEPREARRSLSRADEGVRGGRHRIGRRRRRAVQRAASRRGDARDRAIHPRR